ncbi:MAG: GatB/YqeY domain-containing protein [Bdellovibrionales bacterium]|nr:GatB/YqeY domain-containing protein [Bdellovibrionales bacterium]
MGLKEKILEDLKSAMKAQEVEKLSAIRFLQAAVKNREIELRPQPISDAEIMNVIKKLIKQRQDSIEQFSQAGREDLVNKEKFELALLQSYLPAQLTQEQLVNVIENVIQDLKASSIKQMGQVIKETQNRTQGTADSRQISEIVKSKLSSPSGIQ